MILYLFSRIGGRWGNPLTEKKNILLVSKFRNNPQKHVGVDSYNKVESILMVKRYYNEATL